MIRRLRAAIIWSRILARVRRGDYRQAQELSWKYASLGQRDAVFLAVAATIDVLNFDSLAAREKFLEASAASVGKSQQDCYLRLYCQYYICIINKEENCENLRAEALSYDIPPLLRRWLPLPQNQVTYD